MRGFMFRMAAAMVLGAATVVAGAVTVPGTDVTQPNGVIVHDVKIGTGAVAEAGLFVLVHYTGWLYRPGGSNGGRGTKFDSSRNRGEPFGFPLGGGQVIEGWDSGVEGMKVGGQRTLIIPAGAGYGARGAGAVIPPGATLIFDIELLGVN